MKRKKKKIKIKKKNFTLFILLIMLITYVSFETCCLIVEKITSPKENNVEKKPDESKQKKEKKTKKEEKKKTEEELKLEKLNNINEKIDYFNIKYLDRYIKYKEENNNLSNEQIIKNVNMNLDLTVYVDIKETKFKNDEKILINKYNYVDKNYVPKNLENINKQYALDGMRMVNYAKDAFEKLAKAAKKEGLNIIAMSTYRSYDYQVNLYNRYVKQDGKEAADTYSGRPGHSEHQSGLAVDVYNDKESYTNFEKTKEFKWMQKHAYEYGFILRFPKDKENETGYIYESWHYRYVGYEIAKYIYEHNISYEEYYATIIKDWE